MNAGKLNSIYKLAIIPYFLLILNCSIASVKEGEKKIEQRFLDTVKSSKNSKTATLLVHSDKLNLHIKSASGSVKKDNTNLATTVDQPFHVASIGKVFTAVLLFQLIEEGKLSLNDSISKIVGQELLKGLFVYNGIDYSEKVTISHLLTHTSGVEDYFESVDKKSKSVMDELTKEPNKFWTPVELLDFTRKNQKAVGQPGAKFHYSDTGYILLGLVIEKVTGKKFETILQEKILKPLGMKKTYMHLRSDPLDKSNTPISTIMLGSINVTDYKSVSADWTGGGIISTTEDLFLFHRALINGKLISNKTYLSMIGKNELMSGLYYGAGYITTRFNDMSFLMPKTPELYGHSGLLSTLMYYCPEYDLYIIANLGSTDDVNSSYEMMFWIMQDIKEIKNLKESYK